MLLGIGTGIALMLPFKCQHRLIWSAPKSSDDLFDPHQCHIIPSLVPSQRERGLRSPSSFILSSLHNLIRLCRRDQCLYTHAKKEGWTTYHANN